MKKNILLIILTLCFLVPVGVNADMLPPIGITSYSHEVVVGSTVTYKISGIVQEYEEIGITNLNGKIIYDYSQLEYVDITVDFPEIMEGELPPIDIEINSKNGVIEYKVINEYGVDGRLDILVNFKVKSLPSTGNLKVQFTPENSSVLYEGTSIEIETEVLNNSSLENNTNDNANDDTNNDTSLDNNNSSEGTGKEENTNNQENNSETKEENESQKEDTNSDLLLYIVIGGLSALNLALVVLLISKSKKEKTNNLNQDLDNNQNLNNNLSENNNINNNLNN